MMKAPTTTPETPDGIPNSLSLASL